MNSTIQNRARGQLERQERCRGRVHDLTKETHNIDRSRRTTLIQPPVVDDNSVIDLVESDDKHESSRYTLRTNRGGGVDTTIYDLEEDTWTDDDTSMLAGTSTSLDEAGL